MPDPVLSAARSRAIRRLLWVVVVLGVVLLAASALVLDAGRERYAVTVLVDGVVVLLAATVALRLLAAGARAARAVAIATGVLLLLLAVPVAQIWIGIVMAITAVGLLFVIFAAEQDPA
jgi:hypothetical protein